MIGQIINDRYKILSELGQGGMGTVYRAHDQTLQRDVAVKLMSNTRLGTEGRARLLHEAQTIAQLNHTNIVTVFDAGQFQGSPYIVMEFIEGGTLAEHRPTSLEDIVAVSRQVCTALGHAHQHNIIHRDLKPENIAIDADGIIRLMDFGLARSVASRLTSEGGIVGTVYYMAPEQAMGKEVGPQADLYAIGVILYELTTGALPFEDPDPIAVISQHIHAPPINARLKNPDLPPRLSDLIMSLLNKEPEDRPSSANDLLTAFNDPSLLDTAAVPAEQLSLLDRIVRGRIVGRKQEFEEARSLWTKTKSGQGQLLLISGEPGVGKTRLMREIAIHAEVSGGLALIGESFAEGNPPYGAFGQIVRKALQPGAQNGFEIPDFVLADLLTVAPELRQHYPHVSPNPKLEPEAERQRLFENVTAFGAALSERAPVLIVIDDAHWSDSGTLFLLRHLARRTQNLPVMLVATYREVELIGTHPLNEMLLELNRQRLGTRLKLTRLDLDKTQDLLSAIFAEDVSREFAELVFRDTEGNPFFIEEVCKALVESGVLYYEDGEWHRPDLQDIEIPQSVQVAVEARLAKLEESTLEILRLAAILGREFEFNTLAKASDQSEEELIHALEAAEEAQLLNELSSKAGGVFSFAHALIPAALVSGISGLRRRRLHRQALAAEEKLHPHDFAALAHHASEAGPVEKTLEYSEKAAANAADLYAWEEANRHYRRAIEAAEELNQAEKIVDLHVQAGDARVSQGFRLHSLDHYHRVLELSQDVAVRAEAKLKIGSLNIFSGDDSGYKLLEEARRELDPGTQQPMIAWAHISIGRYNHLHGWHRKALESYQVAQAIAEQLEDWPLLSNVLAFTAGAYQHLALFEKSDEFAQATIDLGQREHIPFAEAVGLEFMGENAANTGRWQDALKAGEREVRIARQIGDMNRHGWVYYYLSYANFGLGELAQAEKNIHTGLEFAELSGDMRLSVLGKANLATLLADMGRYQEAQEMGLEAHEQAQEVGQIFMTANANISLATVYHRLERWEEALQLILEVKDSLEGRDARWFPTLGMPHLAAVYLGLGDLDQARDYAVQCEQAALDIKAAYLQSESRRILAQVAYLREEYDDALEMVDAAIQAAEQERSRLHHGRALLWKAKILAAKEAFADAKKTGVQAAAILEECGALPNVEEARAFLASLD